MASLTKPSGGSPRKILITPATLARGVTGPFLTALQETGYELLYPKRQAQLTEDELMDQLGGVSATLAGSEPYTRKVLDAFPNLRVIARAGVGYDAVDLAAANEHAVAVCITPGTNQDAVAEHTFTLILALAKHLIPQHLGTKLGKWPRQPNLPLRGKTLGIAGLVRIGKAVALRGECFGMKLLAHEPFPDQAFIAQHKIPLVPMEKLFAESDFLTLHVPLNAESKHLINQRTLGLMKPTSFLINTARGGLVCEADLVQALQNKQIAGAGLDVFEQEPPEMGALFQLDNVVLTPHAAGVDLTSLNDMALAAAQAIVKLSRGDWPAEQIVNPEIKPRFKW